MYQPSNLEVRKWLNVDKYTATIIKQVFEWYKTGKVRPSLDRYVAEDNFARNTKVYVTIVLGVSDYGPLDRVKIAMRIISDVLDEELQYEGLEYVVDLPKGGVVAEKLDGEWYLAVYHR